VYSKRLRQLLVQISLGVWSVGHDRRGRAGPNVPSECFRQVQASTSLTVWYNIVEPFRDRKSASCVLVFDSIFKPDLPSLFLHCSFRVNLE
jgi:hypothetical protein